MEASLHLFQRARSRLIGNIKRQTQRLRNFSKKRKNGAEAPETTWRPVTPEYHNDNGDMPSKITQFQEGSRTRTAILPSQKLVEELEAAIQDHRNMIDTENEFSSQIDVWKSQHDLLHAQIGKFEAKLKASPADGIGGDSILQETKSMQEELLRLKQQKQAILDERDAGQKALQSRYEELRHYQFDLFEMLKELFEVEPVKVVETRKASADASSLHEISDKSQQQQSEQVETVKGSESVPDLQLTKYVPSKTAEDMLQVIHCWATEVERCQYCLNHRHEKFQRLWQERSGAIERGEEVQTDEEFEVFCFQETQRFTRELIRAEAQIEEAKQAALDAGIQPLGSDLESGFLDRDDDGYLESEEREMCEAIDHERIQRWIEGTPDTEQPTGQAHHLLTRLDLSAFESQSRWQAKEVEVWESASMVAEGPNRRRIDKWREIADSQGNGLHDEVFDGHPCQEYCGEGLEASSSWGKDLTAAMKSVGEE